jgi:hypothetical protein
MASKTDQTLRVIDKPIVNESKSDSGTESDISAAVSSSSNMATTKMVEKTTPEMVDYWKKTTVTEADHKAYHSFGWLNGGLEYSVLIVEYPIVDDITMVCFESHLVARLELPPNYHTRFCKQNQVLIACVPKIIYSTHINIKCSQIYKYHE